MKPSWDQAPEWANYLAMDADGTWYWYKNQPELNVSGYWECPTGDFENACGNAQWYLTLESKP